MVEDILTHHGIKGQKWGMRRFQNPDGSLTEKGKKRVQKIKTKQDKVVKKINRYKMESSKSRPVLDYFKNLGGNTDVAPRSLLMKVREEAAAVYRNDLKAERLIKKYLRLNTKLSAIDQESVDRGRALTEELLKQSLGIV